MIRSNLSTLLNERKLKISKVAEDTGISRTTLTALCSNKCQGIQLPTVDKLCKYLGTTPNGLLEFVNVDIELNDMESKSDNEMFFWYTIERHGVEYMAQTLAVIKIAESHAGTKHIHVHQTLPDILRGTEHGKAIAEAFGMLSRSFITDIEEDIILNLSDCLGLSNADKVNYVFTWDSSLGVL